MKSHLTLCLCLSIAFQVFGQNKSESIFTYGGNAVTLEEFEKVYTKNNINNQANYSEKSIRDYLELFINFKLKTKEALAQQIDTISSLKTELGGYRKQLAQAYLTDMTLQENLFQEAYNRMQSDVKVSHILIKCNADASPADTLIAYNKIKAIKAQVMKPGADFGTIASKNSEDPSVKFNKGSIGYITGLMTAYAFENAVFNTPVSKVSDITRTKFGYHIIKVEEKRAARGKMVAAHILVKSSDTSSAADKDAARKKINGIHAGLMSKTLDWAEAVKSSDDKYTSERGGELPEFGINRMIKEFEDAAFALQKDGEISSPVLTKFGWHIIKRVSKVAVKPYEQSKKELKLAIEKDERNNLPKASFYAKIKKEYGFTEFAPAKTELFNAIPDTAFTTNNWDFMGKFKGESKLFSIGDKSFTQRDYLDHLLKFYRRNFGKNKAETLETAYKSFADEQLMAYEEARLEEKHIKFKELMKEYSDGVYLFELTDREVWGKASKDSIGLRKFFEENKGKYRWGKRAIVTIFNATDEKIAKAAYKLAGTAVSPKEIEKKLNKDEKSKVSTIDGKFEKGKYALVDSIEWKAGLSPMKKNADNSYTFVKVHSITESDIKELHEARGYYVSDYQNFLEKEWIRNLRAKYPIVVNEPVVKSIIK